MNLDYGKFDPMWRGEWSHVARHDPQASRWSVMMTIPLKSIPPAAAKPRLSPPFAKTAFPC